MRALPDNLAVLDDQKGKPVSHRRFERLVDFGIFDLMGE